jgi:trehalose 6-phosphate synthase
LLHCRAGRRFVDAPLVHTDLDIRSDLIASTVQDPLSGLIVTGSTPRIATFFNRMLLDERLYAVGLCVDAESAPLATNQFPQEIRCSSLDTYADGGTRLLRTSRGMLHIAVRSVDGGATPDARLVLVHEMSFVERRSEETRRYSSTSSSRSPRASRSSRWSSRNSRGAAGSQASRLACAVKASCVRPVVHGAGTAPDRRDLRDLIRDLERQYRPLDGSQRIWDQERCGRRCGANCTATT